MGVILSDEERRPHWADCIAKDPAKPIKRFPIASGVGRFDVTANNVPLPKMSRGILHDCSGADLRRNLTLFRMTILVVAA